MNLEPQTAELKFRVGLDEGVDPGADPQGLLTLTNGMYDSEGALCRRHGFTLESDFTANGDRGLVVAGGTLGIVQRDAVLIHPPGAVEAPANWGRSHSLLSRPVAVLHGGRTVLSVDHAYLSIGGREYVCVVTLEGDSATVSLDGQAWTRVYDYVTGTLLYEARSEPSTIGDWGVRVVTHGSQFLVITQSTHAGPSVIIRARPLTTGTWGGTPFNVTTDCATNLGEAWDAVYDAATTSTYVGFITATGNDAKVAKITTTAVTATSAAATTAAEDSQSTGLCVNVIVMGAWVVMSFIADSDDQIELQSFATSDLSLGDTHDTVRADRRRCALIAQSSTAFRMVTADTIRNLHVEDFTLNQGTGVIAQPVTVITTPNLFPITKPFLGPGGRYLVGVIQCASEEHGYLGVHLFDIVSSTVVGTVAHDESQVYKVTDVVPGRHMLSSPATVSAGSRWSIAVPVSLESMGAYFATASTAETTAYRARVVELSAAADPLPTTTLGGSVFLAGSLPRQFDGFVTAEAAFIGAPRKPTLAASAGVGLTPGVYSYAVVLERVDARGNIILSPPSAISTITLVADLQVNVTAMFTVPIGYDLGSLVAGRTKVRVYRTTSSGSVFHLLRSFDIAQNTSVTFTDSTTDVNLEVGEIFDVLSTDELLSEPVPALRAIWAHRSRLMGIRADTPTVLAYTLEQQGDPMVPRWNGLLTKAVENGGGELIAGGSLGNMCILFQRSQILALGGEGPTNAGPDATGDGFVGPELVSTGVGARDAIAVVSIPGGLFFRAPQGFHVLGQDMSMNFIGRPVQESERAMGDTTAAAYLPAVHQLWIAGESSPSILVYDTRFGRWFKFVGPWSSDVVVGIAEVSGVVYVLTRGSTARLWRYDTSTWLDGATAFSMTVDTPWFRPAGDAGMGRMWRVLLLTNLATALRTSLVIKTYTYQSHRAIGKDSEVADGEHEFLVGTPGETYPDGVAEFRIRPTVQRCSAFRLQIVVAHEGNPLTDPPLPADEGPRLISLKYLFGVIRGDAKSPQLPTVT